MYFLKLILMQNINTWLISDCYCNQDIMKNVPSNTITLTDMPRNCVLLIAEYISSAVSLSVYVKFFRLFPCLCSRSMVLLNAGSKENVSWSNERTMQLSDILWCDKTKGYWNYIHNDTTGLFNFTSFHQKARYTIGMGTF